MKLLITGTKGLLGSAVADYFRKISEVVAYSHAQLDITDRDQVNKIVKDIKPSIIINCAAMARVDVCETTSKEAYAVNSYGPGYLATAANEIGAAIMHISTDYVFDGEKRTPYTTEDRPNPISTYGKTKLLGEQEVIAANKQHFIVRVARLFGLAGTNFGSGIFNYFETSIKQQTRMKVCTHPISQATYVSDLVMRMHEIILKASHGIYQVTNSGPIVSWEEFTEIAADMGGFNKDIIQIVSYEDLGLPALRPVYSALKCLKSQQMDLAPLPDWREGLKAVYHYWRTHSNL